MHTSKPKFILNNATIEKADFIIAGVPDESRSYSKRKGVSKAPDAIRHFSSNTEILSPSPKDIDCKVCDIGNIKRDEVQKIVSEIIDIDKIPIIIGGDHSITLDVLKAADSKRDQFSLVYLDAHPDAVVTIPDYYGSVIYDVSRLANVNMKTSYIIGARSFEREEVNSLKEIGINVITTIDIVKQGIRNTLKEVNSNLGRNSYLSIDMDCVDPSFAPGVSEPVPGGLTSAEILYLIDGLSKRINIGVDLMEVNPVYDHNNLTVSLATMILTQAISSIGSIKANIRR